MYVIYGAIQHWGNASSRSCRCSRIAVCCMHNDTDFKPGACSLLSDRQALLDRLRVWNDAWWSRETDLSAGQVGAHGWWNTLRRPPVVHRRIPSGTRRTDRRLLNATICRLGLISHTLHHIEHIRNLSTGRFFQLFRQGRLDQSNTGFGRMTNVLDRSRIWADR